MKLVLHRGNNNLFFSRGLMLIIIVAALFFLSGFFVADAQINYTRTPAGTDVSSPVQINVSWSSLQADLCQFTEVGSDPVFIQLGVYGDSGGFFSSVQSQANEADPGSISNGFTLPSGNYNRVIFYCNPVSNVDENGELTGGYEINLEGDGGSTIFTIPEGAGASTGSIGASSLVTYLPDVQLLSPAIEPFGHFSGVLSLKYKASDKDDENGHPEHGLKANPVNIYYSPPESFDRFPIAENQSATGTVLWDTSKLADGIYRLVLKVIGADGVFNEKVFENVVLDNTSPHFTIKTNPYFSKGEPVQITVESSEILKNIPDLTVSQLRHEAVKVKLSGDALGKIFKGTYSVLGGFDGPAKIQIQAEDLAGNAGNAILGNDSFTIGLNPPATPVVETPDKSVRTDKTSIPLIKGTAVNAKRIFLKVNGTKEYFADGSKNGQFQFENIALEPNFNKGKNIISITSIDEKGAFSEPATLEVFANSAPQVNLLEPKGRLLKLNGLVRFAWFASDINGDSLKFTVELSDDGGNSWKVLAQNIDKSEFTWDSTAFPDGSNYVARITVSDGSLTGSASSDKITILNDLPAIILDTGGEIFTSLSSKTINGIVRSKTEFLAKLEFSLDSGKTWKEILPEDGSWNSSFEKFSFKLTSLKAGANEQQIILRGISVSKKMIVNSQGLKIIFDRIAPQLSVEQLPDKVLTSRFLVLSGTAKDNLSGIKAIEYSIDDSKWYEASFEGNAGILNTTFDINHSEPLSDGDHVIKIKAVDRADNESGTQSEDFTIDATPPRIGSFMLKAGGKIIFPDQNNVFQISASSSVNFQLAIAGRPKNAELWLDEKNLDLKFNETTKLWGSDFVFNGQNPASLKITAEDDAGNKVERELAKLSLPQNQNVVLPENSAIKQNFWQKLVNFFKK